MSENTPYQIAQLAADDIAIKSGKSKHDVLVVLGSGWTPAVDELAPSGVDISVDQITGFAPPSVEGHAGVLRSCEIKGSNVLLQIGRTHYYEGKGVDAVVHAVRSAAATGVKTIILTNAAGGLHLAWKPGTAVLISDHINLTGATPLVGPRFIDVSQVYSKRLRGIAKEIDAELPEGVYAQFHGPQYETPAEVKMAITLGADLVGMSTALEAIAAKEAGCEVLGISMVTNPGAGLTDALLNHEEVLAAGKAAAGEMGKLLRQVIEKL
jgi:purine-nucleoside phosphorylase